ncbi:uncharacterized protein ARB_03829 [Trichophyton benhamiae CBS 112371]|uniref:Uncharacterized protein n=1 Tax=Arthroderma benhamiae (strain ATCC MYA-4681 / CBS 112371) TaxID=663331 RepID=D4B5S2_ARTBC|nr:uncharacterized protein ARB_03829 [Trichophyton benhamiae CBS 112371]EFE29258.1 hypothetical protein ARB_03829 [Trichophyton benhamiae CBS 112371]
MVVREAANPVRVVFAGGPIVDWGWDWRNDKRELDVVDVGVGAAELRFDKLGLGLWLGIVLEAVEEARDAAGVPGPANCFTGDLLTRNTRPKALGAGEGLEAAELDFFPPGVDDIKLCLLVPTAPPGGTIIDPGLPLPSRPLFGATLGSSFLACSTISTMADARTNMPNPYSHSKYLSP